MPMLVTVRVPFIVHFWPFFVFLQVWVIGVVHDPVKSGPILETVTDKGFDQPDLTDVSAAHLALALTR